MNKVGNYIALNPKKSLLILSPGFPASEAETDCISALQLFLKELYQRDIMNIHIISFHYPYKSRVYKWHGITVYALGGSNKQGVRRFSRMWKCFKIATKIHQNEPLSYIHSFWLGECAWVANQLSKKLGITHFCTLMGQDVLSANRYVKQLRPMPKLFALSSSHRRALFENHGIEANIIIPWGLENNKPTVEYERTIDVLGVGNFTSLKNFQSFVHIIHSLQKDRPNIQAALIGSGTEKDQIIQLIEKLKLNDNIVLLSQMNRSEVLKWMQQSKCLLHCSTFESFGMVIIEALAQGANVVSKKVGIAEEIEAVHTFESDDEAVLILNKLLDLNLAAENATSLFPIENTVNQYLKKVYLEG